MWGTKRENYFCVSVCVYNDVVLTGIFRVNRVRWTGLNRMNAHLCAENIVVFAPTCSGLQEFLGNTEILFQFSNFRLLMLRR